jgi:predicted phosphodiesterase
MLKVQLMSDLHLEFHADNGWSFMESIVPAADTLVLAGDIMPLHYFTQVVKTYKIVCSKFKTVILVPGNHEFYGTTPQEGWNILDALEDPLPNLRVLDAGEVAHVDGHRIVGATMWFADDYLNAMYKSGMNDFFQIKDFVPWVYYQNQEWVRFLRDGLKEGDIVVTHHLPSYKLVAPAYSRSSLNRFFVSESDEWIHEKKPSLWLFGHTHDSCDQMVASTRCVANPFGYRGTNAAFNEQLVLEVP